MEASNSTYMYTFRVKIACALEIKKKISHGRLFGALTAVRSKISLFKLVRPICSFVVNRNVIFMGTLSAKYIESSAMVY